MTKVRYEFLNLGTGGSGSPSNIIRGKQPVSGFIEVGPTATAADDRLSVPVGDEWGKALRLTPMGDVPVFVSWGANPTATLLNSLMLLPSVSEVIYIEDGAKISMIAPDAV